MDRLICGDVGFGKTEIAMRAAFKAAAAGKQVLVLVPTTILAQQHLATFRERFGDLPVSVDMVNRFRSPAETREVLGALPRRPARHPHRHPPPAVDGRAAQGPRPGHRRRGAALRRGPEGGPAPAARCASDVLAMSATPIPRTLQISLSGLRDISVIETPPPGRRPIATHVGEYDEALVAEALRREARARRPELLPAQPRRDHRGGRRGAARAGARAAHRHRPRPDGTSTSWRT